MQYEPGPRRRWRLGRRTRRHILIGAVVLFALALWYSRLPHQALAAYRVARCASYRAAPDALVYEEHNGTTAAAAAAAAAGEAPAWPANTVRSLPLSDPTGTRRYDRLPRCLASFFGSQEVAPLFVGELTAEDGKRCTIAFVMNVERPSPRARTFKNVFKPDFCRQLSPETEQRLQPLGPQWGKTGSKFVLFNYAKLWKRFDFDCAAVLRFHAGSTRCREPVGVYRRLRRGRPPRADAWTSGRRSNPHAEPRTGPP